MGGTVIVRFGSYAAFAGWKISLAPLDFVVRILFVVGMFWARCVKGQVLSI